MLSERPCTAVSDASPPERLSSSQVTNATSLSPGLDIVAAAALKRFGATALLAWTSSPSRPWLAESTRALTVGLVEKVSALFCIQLARKRPPGNGATAGEEQLIPRSLVAVN